MEIRDIRVRADGDYPQIINADNNPRVVATLKDLLSARAGEITGVMQYFYQSRIAHNVEDEISQILEEISVVEMGHMELLMNAIIDFGGVPTYANSRAQFFNSNYVNYSTKLKDMLDADIIAEETAIRDYSNAINQVQNQSLRNLLSRIIEDEQLHLQTLKRLRDSVSFLSI